MFFPILQTNCLLSVNIRIINFSHPSILSFQAFWMRNENWKKFPLHISALLRRAFHFSFSSALFEFSISGATPSAASTSPLPDMRNAKIRECAIAKKRAAKCCFTRGLIKTTAAAGEKIYQRVRGSKL